MDAKRGSVPEDERNFSLEALAMLRRASGHVLYLLNEGYDLKQATTFIGNHFMLSERQRLAIMRSVVSSCQLAERKKKELPINGLQGQAVWIDGFNTIITLEVMLCDSLLFQCMDGSFRDLAALRGTYRLIPETAGAVKMMLGVLQDADVRKVNILLDQPVSNSGRLKALIADTADAGEYTFDLDIQILRDVDRQLYQKECVGTSDSVILDHCISWVNLAGECITRVGARSLRIWE